MVNRLECTNLTVKWAQVAAVSNVTLSLTAGMIIGLEGANGSGKTSLLRALAGELRPSSGLVRFNGHSIAGQGLARVARMGVLLMPQREIFVSDLSVQSTLETAIIAPAVRSVIDVVKMIIWPPMITKERQDRINDSLRIVNLVDCAHQLCQHLSFGQRRRLMLAVCLVNAPKVLILDEPFAGMDRATIDSLLGVLMSLSRSGKAIMISDHDVGRIRSISDIILSMSNGYCSDVTPRPYV